MKLQLKRSVALDGTSPNQTPKPPTAEQMNYGELAVNYNSSFGPVVFTKDSSDNIIEIVPKLSTIVRTDQTSTQVVSSKIETLATISGDSSTTVTTKGYVDTVDATKLNLTGGIMTGDITWNSSQTFIGANVTGILSISTTGNAATATQLTNTRTIGGTGFNGTVNIDIAELNAQPASYYLDASNLNAGTVPLARLSDASTSVKGIVQLSSATNSTSEALGATSKAVKNAYDLADAALPKSGGSMDNNAVITFSSAQTFDPTKISAGTLPLTVLARAYTDGSIYDADINSLANISLDKLATGALPTAITITTFNVVDGTLTNNDISSTAAIAFSKLQTGTLPSGIQVTSANITDLEIVNSDVSNSAAIAGTKIVGATTSVVGTVQLTSVVNSTSEVLAATGLAVKNTYDLANSALQRSGGFMTGVITFNSGQTFDPTKISAGPLPSNVTVSTTNIVDGTIVDADISNTAAIAASKIVSASTSGKGVVQLSSVVNSTSEIVAATSAAVKIAYDAAMDQSEISVGVDPPSNPSQGDLWWDSSPTIGNAFIYYVDANSSQWVPMVPGTPEVDYTRVVVLDSTSAQTMVGDLLIPATTGGTSNSAAVTKLYVDTAITAEDFWDRTNTTLSPNTANDVADIAIAYSGTAASSFGGAATFASYLNVGDSVYTGSRYANGTGSLLSSSGTVYLRCDNGSDFFSCYVGATDQKVQITAAGAATFAGTVTAGGNILLDPSNTRLTVGSDSGTIYTGINNGTMIVRNDESAGACLSIYNNDLGDYSITLDMDGSATFAGDLQIAGNPGAGVVGIMNSSSGFVSACRSNATVWNGYEQGSGTATSSISSTGAATFADGKFDLDSNGRLNLRNDISSGQILQCYSGGFAGTDMVATILATGSAAFGNTAGGGSGTGGMEFTASNGQIDLVNTNSGSFLSCYNRSTTSVVASISAAGAATFSPTGAKGIVVEADNRWGNECLVLQNTNTSASSTYHTLLCKNQAGANAFSVTLAGAATFAGSVISGSLAHSGGGGNYFSSGEIAAYSSTSSSYLWRGWDAASGSANTLTSSITAAGAANFADTVIVGSNANPLTAGKWGYQVYGTNNENGLAVYNASAGSNNSPPYLLRGWVNGSDVAAIFMDGTADFTGAVSKGSGSFKISHPLPEKTETHHLVHSFIEGPQADLIYSGMVTLVDGKAEINLDTAARMTEGTFLLLNANLRRFVSNEGGWTAVRSSITGNVLTVEAQDDTCTDEVFWTVIGERKDQHMLETGWTDENGRVITEPLKPVEENS